MGAIVRTITGDVAPEALGVTLCHEHLLTRPPAWLLERDPELLLGDVDGIGVELDAFVAAGGHALVEMTTVDYGRDVGAALAGARGRDVLVIQATGLQKGVLYPPWVAGAEVDAIAAPMVADVRDGIDGGPRAGVIKAGTCRTDGMRDDERRVFAAVAAAHHVTGAPISTHTEAGTLGHEQLDAFEAAGVDPGRVLLGHLDRRLDWDYHRSLAARGCWLGYDHVSKEQYEPDAKRREFVLRLLEEGFDKVMVAGDLGRNRYQPAYGGSPGFAGILERVRSWFDDDVLRRLLVENPARFFAFEPT